VTLPNNRHQLLSHHGSLSNMNIWHHGLFEFSYNLIGWLTSTVKRHKKVNILLKDLSLFVKRLFVDYDLKVLGK